MSSCTVSEGCQNEPVVAYTWPWGETGLCCAQHQVILNQKQKQLKQRVAVSAIVPGAPAPMTRDERIGMKASILALEEELTEVRERGMQVYQDNEKLRQQARTDGAKRAQLEHEVASLTKRCEDLLAQVGAAREQAAKENAELQRIKALLPRENLTRPSP